MAPASTPAPEPAGAAPYGPNTPAVRRFLQRFAALSPDDWDAAAVAYASLAPASALAADRDLGRVYERAARTAERDAVLGPLLQLVRVDAPAKDGEPEGADAPAAMHPVAEAALAATLALIVRDLLPPRAFATLYGPFAALVPLAALDPAPSAAESSAG